VDGVAEGSVRGIHTAAGNTLRVDAMAIGTGTTASGEASFAQGKSTYAGGEASHAEGMYTYAIGEMSHAEGFYSEASGNYSHAEGYTTRAGGVGSHSEGFATEATGAYAHAEGYATQARGGYSHAANYETIAQNDYQTVIGKYNIVSNPATNGQQYDDALIIGNGSSVARSNALRVTFNGNVYSASGSYTAGADYAEMFEWLDGNVQSEDRRGYFVTLDGERIRMATEKDDYVLGVVSATPAVVGDACGCGWQGMYMRDEWGEVIHEWVEMPQEIITYDKESDEQQTQTKMKRHFLPKLNPAYDASQAYIPRTERAEWATVGLMGKLIVRDDGACRPNGYCRPNAQGAATASERGYRVLKRVSADKVKILLG